MDSFIHFIHFVYLSPSFFSLFRIEIGGDERIESIDRFTHRLIISLCWSIFFFFILLFDSIQVDNRRQQWIQRILPDETDWMTISSAMTKRNSVFIIIILIWNSRSSSEEVEEEMDNWIWMNLLATFYYHSCKMKMKCVNLFFFFEFKHSPPFNNNNKRFIRLIFFFPVFVNKFQFWICYLQPWRRNCKDNVLGKVLLLLPLTKYSKRKNVNRFDQFKAIIIIIVDYDNDISKIDRNSLNSLMNFFFRGASPIILDNKMDPNNNSNNRKKEYTTFLAMFNLIFLFGHSNDAQRERTKWPKYSIEILKHVCINIEYYAQQHISIWHGRLNIFNSPVFFRLISFFFPKKVPYFLVIW